jgi:hypothetical protein
MNGIRSTLFCVLFLSPSLSLALTCQESRFSHPPEIGADQILKVEIYTDCTLAAAEGKPILSLRGELERNALFGATLIKGPTSEVFRGLNGVKYEVSQTARIHGSALIKRDIHSATDGIENLVLESLSTSIEATGDAALTKKSDWAFYLKRLDGQNFTFRFLQRTFILKKGPAALFKQMALSHLKNDMTRDLEKIKKLTLQNPIFDTQE